jgi:ATP-dependent RNA helicase DDX55/SPB4
MKTAQKKQKSTKKARKATREEEASDENSKEDSTSLPQQPPDSKHSGSSHPQSFENFRHPRPLSRGVLEYVTVQNFTRMTPVQAATIPQFLSRKDVAVQAVTGSGKTLAFLVPVVETLIQLSDDIHLKNKKKKQIMALILSPTRELAQQTYTVAKELFSYCQQPEPLLLVGGSSASGSASTTRPVTADLQNFQKLGSTVVIGTPGRVQDVLTRYDAVDTSELECLVLDEADVLLNMGFATTLQDILSRLPKMRRTALFSATQSSSTTTNSSLKEWMNRVGMRNPIWIDVAVTSHSSGTPRDKSNDKTTYKPQATPSSLTNYYIVTKLDEKISRLYAFLKQHREEKVIVFFLTCCCVDFYGSAFQQLFPELSIELLHGKMNQKRREKTMERFRDDNTTALALFCTDVAARGLDVTAVSWVVQFDAPQDPAFFVHRVGRSARAGKKGNSLLFLTGKEEPYVDLLRMRNVPLQTLPTSETCCTPTEQEPKIAIKKISHDDGQNSHEEKIPPAGTRRARLIRSAANPAMILDDVLPQIRGIVLKDRDLLEKGTKAYTSYIRAYKEHHCAFIFR